MTINYCRLTQPANIISTNDSAEDAEFMLIAYRKSRPSFWTLRGQQCAEINIFSL